ncbi:MAG: phage tail spike protein [Christensenellales bacterium]
MGEIYVFGRDEADFSTTGLCGALLAETCTCEMRAGEVPHLALSHPYDGGGRWRNLIVGNILSAPCRVRMTPEMNGTAYVRTVEIWSVADTATWVQRGVFTKPIGGKRKGTLSLNADVTVVARQAQRCKIKSGRINGWVGADALSVRKQTLTLPDTATGMEDAAAPLSVKRQLFRIIETERDAKSGKIEVKAMHIAFDASKIVTTFSHSTAITGLSALGDVDEETGIVTGGIFGNLELLGGEDPGIRCYTDIADSVIGVDWRDRNALEALLNPEDGFCAVFSAQPVFDDFEIVILRRAGADRGVRIEHGKNMLGAAMTVSEASTVTAIKPRGRDANGEILYLTDDPQSDENYVTSATGIARAGVIAQALDCADCIVGTGSRKVTKAVARARMRAQAQARFDELHCDEPQVVLDVDFVSLGDTSAFSRYKELEKVFLYDEVTVASQEYGIMAKSTVVRMGWDCLHERATGITLGKIQTGGSVFSWQIRSLRGDALQNGTVSVAKLNGDVGESLSMRGDANIELGTTVINKDAGICVSQQSGTVFQANGERFGLYMADTGAPVAEGGVDDGEGYFASSRLRDPQNSASGHIRLNAIPSGEGGGYEMRLMAPNYEGASAAAPVPEGFISGLAIGVRNLPCPDPQDETRLSNAFSAWIRAGADGILDVGRVRAKAMDTAESGAFQSGGDYPAGSVFSVTLTQGGWNDGAQHIDISDYALKENAVLIVSPAPASFSLAAAYGVYCAGQSAGGIDFACEAAPSGDVLMHVLALGGLTDLGDLTQ